MSDEVQVPERLPLSVEKESWWKSHPGWTVAIVGLLFYLLFIQPFPAGHFMLKLREAIVNNVIVVAALVLVVFVANKLWAEHKEKKERHTVPQVQKNVQEYFKQEKGIVLDWFRLYVADLFPGSSEAGIYLVYSSEQKMAWVYDSRWPPPHIRLEEKIDHFALQQSYNKDEFLKELSNKFLNASGGVLE